MRATKRLSISGAWLARPHERIANPFAGHAEETERVLSAVQLNWSIRSARAMTSTSDATGQCHDIAQHGELPGLNDIGLPG